LGNICKNNLFSNGFGYAWEQQKVINKKLFEKQYVQRLKGQYIQNWTARCRSCSILYSCIHFKQNYNLEKYIAIFDVEKFRSSMAKFRSSCHNLMIEQGRHNNIPRDFRFCPNCETVIEDNIYVCVWAAGLIMQINKFKLHMLTLEQK
jgi:hypothetical protein